MAELTKTLENTNNGLDSLTVALDAFKAGTDVQSALIARLFDPKGKLAEFERKFLESREGIDGILKKRAEDIFGGAQVRFGQEGFSDDQIKARTALLDSFLDNRVEGVLVMASAEIKKADEEIKKMVAGFSASISKAFSEMVVKGEFSAKKIGDAFLRAALQAASQRFIEKPLSGLFSSLFGRAGGGAVSAGTPVLVGERGPEMFVPRIPGAVLNGHDTRRALGGGSPVVINQTLHFTADVRNSVRAEIMNAVPLIANQAVLSVQNSLRGIRI